MSEDFNKYLGIANHDIQMANNIGELKSYVANILYDNDKKIDMIQELEKEIERLNNNINKLEKELEEMATLKTDKYGNTRKITHIDINWLLTKIKELKGVDKE